MGYQPHEKVCSKTPEWMIHTEAYLIFLLHRNCPSISPRKGERRIELSYESCTKRRPHRSCRRPHHRLVHSVAPQVPEVDFEKTRTDRDKHLCVSTPLLDVPHQHLHFFLLRLFILSPLCYIYHQVRSKCAFRRVHWSARSCHETLWRLQMLFKRLDSAQTGSSRSCLTQY